MEHKWQILNYLIEKYDYKDYLEIGHKRGDNLKMINIDMKESVDPVPMKGYPPPNHIMTSDQFFERVGGRRKWDLFPH